MSLKFCACHLKLEARQLETHLYLDGEELLRQRRAIQHQLQAATLLWFFVLFLINLQFINLFGSWSLWYATGLICFYSPYRSLSLAAPAFYFHPCHRSNDDVDDEYFFWLWRTATRWSYAQFCSLNRWTSQGSSPLFACSASHNSLVDELCSKPHASLGYLANFHFVLTTSKILDPMLDYQKFFCSFYLYVLCGAFES